MIALVALAVAIVWPFLFNAWLGADAEDGNDATALEALISALEEATATDVSSLQAEVDDLRATLEALPSGAVDDPAVAAFETRLEALEQEAGGGAAGVPTEVGQALDALQAALDGLDQAVSGIEARVASVESELAQMQGRDEGAAVEELRGTVAGLESTIASIRESLDGMAASADAARAELLSELESTLDARTGALDRRIAALAGSDKTAAAHQSFLIALGQLGAQLRTPQPFAAELGALRQIAAGDDTLAPDVGAAVNEGFAAVEDAADTGIPTLATLQASFDETRLAVLDTFDAPPEDVLDEIWSELGGVVTVQRLEGAGPGTIDAILTAAERALEAGDLASAVDSMEGLEAHGEGPAAAAAPWLASARLRVAAEQALEATYRAAMASFRPTEGAGDAAGDVPANGAPEAADGGGGGGDAAPAPDAAAAD